MANPIGAGVAGASGIGSDVDVDSLTSLEVSFDGIDQATQLADFTVREVILCESLLTPGLQTSMHAHSYLHNLPKKFFDDMKGSGIKIKVTRPGLSQFGFPTTLDVDQTVYRLGGRSSTEASGTDSRQMISRAVEKLTFHACDPTLLADAATLVSKAWKCTTPSSIVSEVLAQCTGATRLNVEQAPPARDYIAENIHPFQVVSQQAQAALAGGNDPSFVHFMTYENKGTHHFRSLYAMTKQAPIIELEYSNAGKSFLLPTSIMNYTFPCDFDLLSDILNGVGADGSDINSLALFNPANKLFSLLGSQARGCGIGSGVFKMSMSNQGSAEQQNMCPDYVSQYMAKRQARMSLLEKDKIALRLTVPWNPIYNAGKVIRIRLRNDEDKTKQVENYGSGDYLISAVLHNIRSGGFSTITMDCVSVSAGVGIV